MEKKKKTFIEQFSEGDRFDELFLVKAVKTGETRAGKPYLVITVMDRSGELSGPVWDDAEKYKALCRVGTVVRCTGLVQTYRDQKQLKFDCIEAIDGEGGDLGDFFPASPRCRKAMEAELQNIIRIVTNPYLKKMLNYFFGCNELREKFKEAPAAKGVHHAYIGGLLEHSLSVASLACHLADHYEGVDRSLLITGALLHDIGKLKELELNNGVIDYTVGGRLKGHLVIGSEMIGKAAATIKNFPAGLLEQLQHLVLSHHGRLEFGSPAVPMTVEAFILNMIDDLDAKMNIIEQLRRKMETGDMQWTEYQRILERFLYLGGFQKKPSEEPEGQAAGRVQPSLF